MSDFGGTTISSSIYREQIAVNGIYVDESLEAAQAALGASSYIDYAKSPF